MIHPSVALTAAHCVEDGGPFKVRAGEYNWEKYNEPLPHQDRMTAKVRVETITMHCSISLFLVSMIILCNSFDTHLLFSFLSHSSKQFVGQAWITP